MAHLFSELEKEDSISQLKRNLVSRFYPLGEEEILRYKDGLNFNNFGLAKNDLVNWNQTLFRKTKDKFDWSHVWMLKTLPIDLSFMIEYEDSIDFSSIALAQNMQWSDGVIDVFGKRINWSSKAYKSGILNSLVKIDRLKNQLDWTKFSRSAKTTFSDDVLEHFSDYWDYEALSRNVNLPISAVFLKKYGAKLNYDILSRNPASFHLIARFPQSKNWNWKRVIQNSALKYNDDNFDWALQHFQKKLNQPRTVKNPRIRDSFGTMAFLIWVFHSHRNDLEYFLQDRFVQHMSWETLSKYCNTPFPDKFISKYWQNIDFRQNSAVKCATEWITEDFLKENLRLFDKSQSSFYHLPLRRDLIESELKNQTNWIWLSSAAQLDWTWDFIYDYWDKFNSNQLSQNRGIYERLIVPEIENAGLESLFE